MGKKNSVKQQEEFERIAKQKEAEKKEQELMKKQQEKERQEQLKINQKAKQDEIDRKNLEKSMEEERKKKEKVHMEKKAKKEEQDRKRQQQDQKRKSQNSRMSSSEDKEKTQKIKDMIQIMILLGLLLGLMGGMKYMEERFAVIGKNRNKENFRDYYEVLELESSVSNIDIKKKYKTLAVQYHPDKNTNCTDCEEKFQEIVKAYEVLGNEKKRKHYDTTSGTMAPIRSSAVELTDENYEQLVEESGNSWVIQVYQDGDGASEGYADMWENVVKEYQGTVRFGRVNRKSAQRAMKRLPFNILLVPTVMTVSPIHQSQILQADDSDNAINALKRLVESLLVNKVNYINAVEAPQVLTGQPDKANVVVYLRSQLTPAYLQYNSDRLSASVSFYSNNQGQYAPLMRAMQSKQNGVFIYPQKFHHIQKSFEFSLTGHKNFRKEFDQILDLAKFISIPQVTNDNFQDLCEKLAQMNEENDTSEDLMDEVVVVVLIDHGQGVDQTSLATVQQFQEGHLTSIQQQVSQGKSMFAEDISKFQVVSANMNQQRSFKCFLNKMSAVAQMDSTQVLAVAIDVTQRRVSLVNNPVQLEDWLEDLVDSRDRVQFLDEKEVRDQLQALGVHKEDSLAQLFVVDHDVYMVYRRFYNNVFDQINLLYFAILVAGLYFINNSSPFINALMIQGMAIFILSVYQIISRLMQ